MFHFSLKAFTQAIVVVLLLLVVPGFASAETLRLSPETGTYEIGQTFPVRVFVSANQSINAVSGVVSFPADKLQVVSLSKTNSIITLWVQEPSFSNGIGTATFEGVVPNPGFIGAGGIVITVNFKVIGSGAAAVKFSSGAVLANDGNGTNILKNLYTATYTLGAATQATPKVENIAPVDTDSSGFTITSTTHPDPQKWYAESDAKFAWNLPEGTKAARLSLGKLPNSMPNVLYEPAISSKKLTNNPDGIWYFHVQLQNDSGWGPVVHRAFQVDTLPPENFTIKRVVDDNADPTDPRPKFLFSVTDVMSGVDHFVIEFDKNKPEIWNNSGNSVYQPSTLPPGDHSLVVKAYDKAGNSSAASIDFNIEGIETPKITSYNQELSNDDDLVIKGTAVPNIEVVLSMTPSDGEPITKSVNADDGGNFVAVISGKEIPKGVYKLTAIAVDKRGAQSEPTSPRTVLVKTSWLESIMSKATKILAFLIPLLALLFLLWYLGIHGLHKMRRTHADLKKELRTIDRQIEKSFDLIKDEVTESLRLLERAKTKREMTLEEDAIIHRLSKSLNDSESLIREEMSKVESQIDS